jgi:hypothetical protein
MKQIPAIYDHITMGRLSKIMYSSQTVISVADEARQDECNECDMVCKNINDCDNFEERK